MTRIIIIALVSVWSFTTASFAQEDSSQNLYFVKKNRKVIFGEHDYQPGKKEAFYIYRNCLYDFVFKDNRQLSIRIIDIRNDSVYYTRHLQEKEVSPNDGREDTLALHPMQLKKLKMIGDRVFGLYSSYSLSKCRYVFEKSDSPKVFITRTTTSYSKDSSRSATYELLPFLTAQGIDIVYEQRGATYYYEGQAPRLDEDTVQKKKPFIAKKWFWYTPSNANKISGLTVGLQTLINDDDSLVIEGVNINADLLSMFITPFLMLRIASSNNLVNMQDTVDKTAMKSRVTGLSLSFGGLVGEMRVRGVSINGGVCSATEVDGLLITGTQNLAHEFKGVAITSLRNMAIKGRGMQIGLLNICKDLKGVQLGLWNVNSKRKLPFINWSF
jgi:hypothetical protein